MRNIDLIARNMTEIRYILGRWLSAREKQRPRRRQTITTTTTMLTTWREKKCESKGRIRRKKKKINGKNAGLAV